MPYERSHSIYMMPQRLSGDLASDHVEESYRSDATIRAIVGRSYRFRLA